MSRDPSGSDGITRGPAASPREPWQRVAADRQSGASDLQQVAIESLRPLARGRGRLRRAEKGWLHRWCRGMRRAQPAMGGLGALSERVEAWLTDASRRSSRGELRRLIERERTLLRSERALLPQRALRALPRRPRLVTYSRSSAVRDLVTRRSRQGAPFELVVLRSEPEREGELLFQELSSQGVSGRLLPDRHASSVLDARSILLLGADTLFSDGTLVHKRGTARLARLAHRGGALVVVLTPSSRILARPGGSRRKWPGPFDATPRKWIDLYLTDRGPWQPPRSALQRPRRPRGKRALA